LGITACKRDEVISGDDPIKTPVINTVNKTRVQPGDTITIAGSNLVQNKLLTELAISGRPAKIVQLEAERITAIVPVNTYSGKLMVTVSNDNHFANAYGPLLTVTGTPHIRSFSPAYAFEGDTVTLLVENFSAADTDNFIAVDGKKMEIIYNNNKDTIKAVIPQGASTAVFTYNTYGGPLYTGPKYLVRKKSYPANTMLEYLAKDPAFSITHYALTHNNSIIQYTYDTLKPYLNGNEPCALFVSNNEGYGPEMKIYSNEDMLRHMSLRPYEMPNRMLSQVLPGFAPPKQLAEGNYATALNEKLIFPTESWRPGRNNQVAITTNGSDFYIQALTLWSSLGNRQKIRFVAQVGNSYLYEITGPLPYDIDF
jgi:hypothetical protein